MNANAKTSSASTHELIAPEDHSDLVGGSSAGKRINCPGSYQMEQKLPKAAKDASSDYADEGSACHAAMAYMLENDIADPQAVLGMKFEKFENWPITQELIDEALRPALDYFDALAERLEQEDGGFEFIVEKRCELPGIPGAFGTSDIIFRTPKRSGILDWKFGAGVPVYAYYEEEQDGGSVLIKPNEQLCFYARAAAHTFPKLFETAKDWPVELHIVMPRYRDGAILDHTTVTMGQLEEFRYQLIRSIAEAKGKEPTLRRGDWCRFAKCKAICPKWTGPVLDLSKLNTLVAKNMAVPDDGRPTALSAELDWPATFAHMLQVADLVEPIIREWRSQAHDFLTNGGKVPGYKLVPTRPTEKYTDEDGARRMAIAKGVGLDDVWAPREMKSPAQLRATLMEKLPGKTKKAREEAAKAEIANFTAKVSSGTTLAHEDDARPSIIPAGDMIKSLADKLKAIR